MKLTAKIHGKTAIGIAGFALASCSPNLEQSSGSPAAADLIGSQIEEREGALTENSMRDVYFGETHLHTAYSLDAFIGGTRLTPDDAYRFARGEQVLVNGEGRQISRPLDFAAVTDHAEYLGEMYSALTEGAPGHDHPEAVQLRELQSVAERTRWFVRLVIANSRSGSPQHAPFYAGEETLRSAWQTTINAAQRHYRPGQFTTLIGFEWSAVQSGGNMHRNILFRGANVPQTPISSIDTTDEQALWRWLASQEAAGHRAFAIPHNSNGSKGLMFADEPVDGDYARTRARFEPLVEMMQVKGNSEVHRSLWPADEFADFENADSVQNSSGRTFRLESFVRWGVIRGLAHRARLGINPFQHGFVGGTDSHSGTPGDTEEANYAGAHSDADNTVELRREGDIAGWMNNRDANPGTLTGVWATRNTRGSIWDAMRARETFATSGTRIRVRFFGGAGLDENPADADQMIQEGYAQGVPMGGLLSASPSAPIFTVWAMKDPDGANLDRIQIIKGWVDSDGTPQERIIDIVWSGDRQRGADGSLPSVGNTVDLATARYRNSIGAPVLMGSWRDPEFDPDQHALYYVRVLEIPTPRWSTYDAIRNGLPLLSDVPSTIQERAWTSPIWYSPAA